MKRSVFITLTLLLCYCNFAFPQQVAINNSITVQQLVEDHLIDGCVEVSNIMSSVNGSVNGFSSFGYFQSGNSNFPFQNGVVLSTGNAASGGNSTITQTLNEGDMTWGTDLDFESVLGITNTFNATSIEFDIISVSNSIQFNYILASEEYSTQYLCDYADGFAFLIKETGSAAPYTNVAVIPNTTTPVSTNSIHGEIFGFCPPQNEAYFDNYNIGDTNYDGRTEILTASTTITPYVQYHVKLIIAEQLDSNYDSSVFILGNSINPDVDLGDDIDTCSSIVALNADIGNVQASYTWSLDGTVISGETSPTLSVSQSGTYAVEIQIPLNIEACVITDEIVVNISGEQSAEPISDYVNCDSGNGFAIFDMSTKDAEVLASVPPGNYTFSYHFSLANAQNNTNPITIPFQNVGSPQIIYARIEDVDNGCLAYAPITLIVNTIPTFVTPPPFEICDDNTPNGIAPFDLTLMDDTITQGQVNLMVTYHETLLDAQSGTNLLISPYNNTSFPSQQLFVSVFDTQTGCTGVTTLTITVIDNPVISHEDVFIDACDDEHDGFATFDLTQSIDDILQGLTNVTVSFYTSQSDAQNEINEIPNPTNFVNTQIEQQIIYVRVEDNITGCSSIRSIEIHTNLLLTGTMIITFSICDYDGDNFEFFGLDAIEIVIMNDIPDVDITFYETEEDRDNNTNPLTGNIGVTGQQTLYISLTNVACTEVAEILLIVNPVIEFSFSTEGEFCDTDTDGFTTVDLSTFDDAITNGTSNFIVRYYETQSDADAGINQLSTFYNNISNPQTVYVGVESLDTGCAHVNTFTINVLPAPAVLQPTDIIVCTSDQNGMAIVNLDDKKSEIVVDENGLTLSFFTSSDDANNNENAIATPSNYNAGSQDIYTRVENNITGCFAIVSFTITINTLPVFPNSISDFQTCEDDNDFMTEFLLEDKDAEILNGQVGKEVLYFESQADATARVNIIDKTVPYTNSQNPQVIHVRVENTSDQNCFEISSFIIKVSPNPLFNDVVDLVICDTNSDGIIDIDFHQTIAQMTQNITDIPNISFYETLPDAQNNENALALTNYTNITNPQQIFVRVENQFSCFVITDLGVNVLPFPEVGQSQTINICDDNADGIGIFDLSASEIEIFDVRQNNIVTAYYETLIDLEMQINQISNPDQYQNLTNPQILYLKITNTLTDCYVSVPITLNVNFPPTINDFGSTTICDNEENTFDLSQVDTMLTNINTDISISYHSNLADAEDNMMPLDTNYIYQSNNDTIYARIYDTAVNCFSIYAFSLIVNENPIANTPANLEACDDNIDGFLQFNLAQQTASVLGNQNPANFTVTYHESLEFANNNIGSLSNLYLAENGQTIYIRIQDNITGCYSTTQFITIVHPLPDLDITDQVICLDNFPLIVSADTNNPGDTYLWSTNETTPEIEITQIGTYWVTATSLLGCQITSEFNVIESEAATIETTETVDFSDPNNITITITGIGNYLYVLDDGEPQESNVFENVPIGYHTVTVIDLNGCAEVSEEVLVIDAPLFFTPNNDGYNDTWHIAGVETLPGTTINIFDRYGKHLCFLTALSQGWDGYYNGNMLPATDYWFVADVKKDAIQFQVKGHFSLRR